MKIPDSEFFDAMMSRFDAIDSRLDRMEARMDSAEDTNSLLLKAVVKLYNASHTH